MTRIDLNEWTLSGSGYFGSSYFNKSDDSVLLKMLKPEFPFSMIEEEFRMALLVHSMGIPSSKPFELVTDGKSFGAIYQRFSDKVSYARKVGQSPELIESLARDLAALVRKLHSTPCSPENFPNVKDRMHNAILADDFRDEEFKCRAIKLLESLPDGRTCIHGDLHFGNVVLSEGKSYFIDLGNFSYGHPYFDLGMTACLIDFAGRHSAQFSENFHCTPEQGVQFCKSFFNNYFGPDVPLEDVLEELKPYFAFCQISSEVAMGVPFSDDEFALTRTLVMG